MYSQTGSKGGPSMVGRRGPRQGSRGNTQPSSVAHRSGPKGPIVADHLFGRFLGIDQVTLVDVRGSIRLSVSGSIIEDEPAGLPAPETVIRPPARKQLRMRAVFDDGAVVEDKNAIQVGDGREPVRPR